MNSESFKFYEGTSNALSPFSAHQIEIWGQLFPTVEHAYQSSRIVPGPERESIKNARSPLAAWELGQKYKSDPNLLVLDFNKDAVMEELFRAKLAQHSDVLEVLKDSGDREILKVIDHDYYWGTGKDGSGQNKMGKLWMKLRGEFCGC
jgi:ribA/ribD-fused uncharacterized protein